MFDRPMFHRLGTFISRHWGLVLLAWAVLVAGVYVAAPRWEDITHDGDFAYLPSRMTSVRGKALLEKAFPNVLSKSQVALIVARGDGELQRADFDVADRLLTEFSPGEQGPAEREAGDPAAVDDDANPVTSVFSYESAVVGRKLISPAGYHGQALLIVLRLRNELMAVDNVPFMERVHRTLAEISAEEDFPPGLELGVTGSAAVGYDYLRSAADSIANTEKTTIALVVLILLLVYRAPGLVLVPLVTIGVSVFVAKGLVAMLTQLSGHVEWFELKVFSTTEIFVVVILFGAGTDYCLFLISRYREELHQGVEPARAVAAALGQVGDALAASALTTVFALGMMFFAEFGKFSNSGPAIALCLLVALGACVTLAPALLSAAGRIVFWPFGIVSAGEKTEEETEEGREKREEGKGKTDPRSSLLSPLSSLLPLRSPKSEEGQGAGSRPLAAGSLRFGGLWEWISRRIMARPGLILMVSLVLMLPLAAVGIDVPITYDLLGELDADRPSVTGTELLRNHFLPGETGPVSVLAYQPDVDFDDDEGRDRIAQLTRELYQLEYEIRQREKTEIIRPILSVRSLTEPFGDPPGSFFSPQGLLRLAASKRPEAKETFVSQADDYAGKVTRLDLIFQFDPFSREAVVLLDYVEEWLSEVSDGSLLEKLDDPSADEYQDLRQLCDAWHGTEFHFIGTTAGIRDLQQVTTSDRLLIQVLVVVAVLAILLVILPCPWRQRPVICVYLILSVLLGYFVTIGVTELFFQWLYGASFHGLDWKVPIFLFVILIAIGEDYNIYLATRVFEEQKRLGPAEGLRVAVVRTGGIITSCGLIMAGTFASMATGSLAAMQQLGFALSLGVLLDTFIIRTILVPAFLALLARRRTEEPPTEEGPRPGPEELITAMAPDQSGPARPAISGFVPRAKG